MICSKQWSCRIVHHKISWHKYRYKRGVTVNLTERKENYFPETVLNWVLNISGTILALKSTLILLSTAQHAIDIPLPPTLYKNTMRTRTSNSILFYHYKRAQYTLGTRHFIWYIIIVPAYVATTEWVEQGLLTQQVTSHWLFLLYVYFSTTKIT